MSEESTKSWAVERHPRQVIENKLLDSLESGEHVAILASRQDLDDLIHALRLAVGYSSNPEGFDHRAADLSDGLERLAKGAFQ